MSGFAAMLEAVRARMSIVDVVAVRVGLRRRGRLYEARCPFHVERTPSFKVDAAKGRFRCYGCDAAGDAIGFVMQHDNLDFKAAVLRLAEELGLAGAPVSPARPRPAPAPMVATRRADGLLRARAAWRSAVPAEGTLVETYLAGRGLPPPIEPSLRFLPAFPYWHQAPDADRPSVIARPPAMVGCMQAGEGGLAAVHVTWLAGDGRGKARLRCPVTGEALPAKKIFGRFGGAALRLSPAAPVMLIGEGIETVKSVKRALIEAGEDAGCGFWVAGSIGNIAGGGLGQGGLREDRWRGDGGVLRLPSVVPDPERPGVLPPAGTVEIVILEDSDNKDPPAAAALYERAARRFRLLGLKVRRARPPAGADFNDMLLEGAA